MFVNKGLIDSKYGRIVNKAFNRRTKGDYDTYVLFEKPIASDLFNEMKEFISTIKKYLDSNQKWPSGRDE